MNATDIQNIINHLLNFANNYQIPLMIVGFFLCVMFKIGSYYSIHCLLGYIRHIEKKIYQHIIEKKSNECDDVRNNFSKLAFKIMEIAHFEFYEMKAKLLRRRWDRVTTISERIFLISEGSRRIMKDTEHQTKYYAQTQNKPDYDDMLGTIMTSNPVYNRVFGLFPADTVNDFLKLTPNLFIIAGIFGTFVGIMIGLPTLGNMDLSDLDMTKKTMNGFLINMAFSMNTSLVGIILGVGMNILNSFFNADTAEAKAYDKFRSCLGLLWHEAQANVGEKQLSLIPENADNLKKTG
jgi:hypothetical protein